MSAKTSLLAELRRRHVYKVGATYAVAGWLLVQIATQVFPFFEISNAAVRWVVIIVIAGLPIALILAWLFDITPQGIVRTDDVDAAGETPAAAREQRGTDRKLNYILGALLVLGAGYLIAERMLPKSDGGSEKSIAVLPFENLSRDPDNAYFAEGIQDEILTRLANIGALKVISRTSTQHYASSPDNLPEIARQLGVANIVEGSVQKAGDAVHINVQLIHAASDAHLWAESYNRKLDDVFGVEGEVAQTIAETLRAKLSGSEAEQLAAKPTDNAAAYDAYLRGIAEENLSFSWEQLRNASAYFAEAVRLDPDFALAWARGSNIDGLIYFQLLDRSAERLQAARHGADMAMKLAPASAEAWLAKGSLLYHTLDFDGASAAFEQARRLQPNSPELQSNIGFLERRRGHYAQAVELLQSSLDRDPLNIRTLTTLADTTLTLNRPVRARQWLDRALAFRPGDPALLVTKAHSFMDEADLDTAGTLLAPLKLQAGDDYAFGTQITYLQYRRDYAPAITGLQSLMHAPAFVLNGWTSIDYPVLGWMQRLAGDEQAARATFTEGRDKIEALRASWNDNGYLASNLALTLAGLGDAEGAQREAEHSIALTETDRYNRDGLRIAQASALALSGRHEAALDLLEALAKGPVAPSYGDLKFNPYWDSLRADPRFAKLLADSAAALHAQAAAP
jgi:TolB-like protein/Tfp pilus assembly protein PilF